MAIGLPITQMGSNEAKETTFMVKRMDLGSSTTKMETSQVKAFSVMISSKVSIFAIMKMGIANGAVPTKHMMAPLPTVEKKANGSAGKRMVRLYGASSPTRRVVPVQNLMNIRSENATVAVKADVQLGLIIAQGAAQNLTNNTEK